MWGLIAAAWQSPLRWLVPLSAALFASSNLLPPSLGLAKLCGTASYAVRVEQFWLMSQAGLVSPMRPVADWFVMTAAMMLPLTSAACARVKHAVATRLRVWAVLLHLAGYILVWLIAGLMLVPLGFAIEDTATPGLLIGLGMALCWSASPLAQRARNQMHRPLRIRAFGGRALLDSLRSGAVQAGPCILSCWPWMVIPFLAGEAHRPAMVLAALYLWLDRMEPPGGPRWQVPPAIGTMARVLEMRPQLAIVRG